MRRLLLAALVIAAACAVAFAVMPGSGRAVGVGPLGAGYQITGANVEVTAVAPDPQQQVTSLTLPPGSYAISLQYNVQKDSGDGVLACAVTTPGLYNAPVAGWFSLGTDPGDQRAAQFGGTGLDVLPNGGTARVVCRQFNDATGDNPVIEQFALTAVRIASVSEQQ